MNLNLFEIAARKKFRYNSVRGQLTVEQLWDLPLSSQNGLNLDQVAQAANAELKLVSTESFVPTNTSGEDVEAQQKLDVVKRIIEIKVAERKSAEEQVERAAKRRKILDALAEKRDQKLSESSIEDLEKQLAELDA